MTSPTKPFGPLKSPITNFGWPFVLQNLDFWGQETECYWDTVHSFVSDLVSYFSIPTGQEELAAQQFNAVSEDPQHVRPRNVSVSCLVPRASTQHVLTDQLLKTIHYGVVTALGTVVI